MPAALVARAIAGPRERGSPARPLPALADHYAVLGVSRDATALEIRDAYRRLILLAHPDRAGAVGLADGAAASLLNVAWETLSDPARRRAHDQQLARQRRASRGRLCEAC